ncbi:hypothetical protein AX774_g1966 [Zancudomyces culisetae]|uniref:Uncharacterized protein n=1 Tax=Zancudomyces culisetae TaxID=1213189 RepID=A0A1R1PU93_ZANCU|nr:hypothetical protein AX774_g1966 [Zancudomyces culisetae]|eukprot:OMH84507.1 hypothetical protein AX774_g1966 [Zancudomyces culisetae]
MSSFGRPLLKNGIPSIHSNHYNGSSKKHSTFTRSDGNIFVGNNEDNKANSGNDISLDGEHHQRCSDQSIEDFVNQHSEENKNKLVVSKAALGDKEDGGGFKAYYMSQGTPIAQDLLMGFNHVNSSCTSNLEGDRRKQKVKKTSVNTNISYNNSFNNISNTYEGYSSKTGSGNLSGAELLRTFSLKTLNGLLKFSGNKKNKRYGVNLKSSQHSVLGDFHSGNKTAAYSIGEGTYDNTHVSISKTQGENGDTVSINSNTQKSSNDTFNINGSDIINGNTKAPTTSIPSLSRKLSRETSEMYVEPDYNVDNKSSNGNSKVVNVNSLENIAEMENENENDVKVQSDIKIQNDIKTKDDNINATNNDQNNSIDSIIHQESSTNHALQNNFVDHFERSSFNQQTKTFQTEQERDVAEKDETLIYSKATLAVNDGPSQDADYYYDQYVENQQTLAILNTIVNSKPLFTIPTIPSINSKIRLNANARLKHSADGMDSISSIRHWCRWYATIDKPTGGILWTNE